LNLIVDVKTREEYYKKHIKGALNIPLWDLKFYLDFLENKKVMVYCGPRGDRSEMAVDYLQEKGIDATPIPPSELGDYGTIENSMICAINYLSIKPGHEEKFEQEVEDLCMKTVNKDGFIGTKVFKATDISYGGAMLEGKYKEIEIKPTKYVMLTYWTSREAHEKFHELPEILGEFKGLMEHVAITPYEEFAEVIR